MKAETKRQTLQLYVVRDLNDGAILFVSDQRDEAEADCAGYLGTFCCPPGYDSNVPTLPVMETHTVRLGRMPVPPVTGKALRPRVRSRQRRQRKRLDRMIALIEAPSVDRKGGGT